MTNRINFVLSYIVLITLCCVVLYSQPGRSQGDSSTSYISPLIVLVTMENCCNDEAWPEAEKEIQKEFAVLRLNVKKIEGEATGEKERRLELNNLATQYSAAAAVRVVKTTAAKGAGVDVWVNDRVTNKLTYRYVPIDNIESEEAPTVAALRIVELLQASLMELTINNSPKEAQPLPEEIKAIVPTPKVINTRHKLRLGMGAAFIGSPGGVGPLGGLELHIGWLPLKWLSFDLESHVTILGKKIKDQNSESTFDLFSLRLFSSIHFENVSIIQPFVGLGVGFSNIWTDGSSDTEIETSRDNVATGGVFGRFGVALKLSNSIWIPISATFGTLFSKVDIEFGQQSVAKFGVPTFEGLISLEMHFW